MMVTLIACTLQLDYFRNKINNEIRTELGWWKYA